MKNIEKETIYNLMKFQDFIDVNNLNFYHDLYKSESNLKISSYEKIIKEIANNIKIIALPDNTISYSYLLFLFFHTGYLSKTKMNAKMVTNYEDVKGHLGINVIKGKACCRHAASFHEDVFNLLGEVGLSICTTTDERINEEFPEISNHMMNIIKYCGTYYAHDILNGIFYYFKTPLVLKSYKNDVPIEFKYQMHHPIDDIKLIGKTELEILKIINDITENQNKIMNNQELYEIIDATNARFYGSIKELEKYKKRTRILFLKISLGIFN